MSNGNIEFSEENDSELSGAETQQFSEAVLHSADWTVETIVSQLTRGNIEMNPRFQRRDAWPKRRKSAFIESLILGLPVPQIVLAEKRGQRGKYIVLDGKQRLLSLLQFTGSAEGENNAFRLSGLEGRPDLQRKTFQNLKDPDFENDLNAFLNYTIRTVLIRNWPNYEFLHLVFLRLNTGSVKLSPQELRQAMFPGTFSNFVDDYAAGSEPLLQMMHRSTPDPRMRDVELLVRFLSFHFYLAEYGGRMKLFLDSTCERLNATWENDEARVQTAVAAFDDSIRALVNIFGADAVARKAGSRSFNRAIFDALAFYAANEAIRHAMVANQTGVRDAYARIVANHAFIEASESDTASIPNTIARLALWGRELQAAIGTEIGLPEMVTINEQNQEVRTTIRFGGFGV